MPKIRSYQQQVSRTTDVQGPKVTAAHFGGLEAQAAQQLGQAVSGVGNSLMKIAEQQETLELTKKMAEADAALTKEFDDRLKQGGDPKEFAENFNKRVDEVYSKIGEGILTSSAKNFYTQRSIGARKQFTMDAMEGQAQLRASAGMDALNTNINQRTSALATSPADFDKQVAAFGADVDKMVETGVFGVKEAVKIKADAYNMFAQKSVKGWMLKDDPRLSLKALESGMYDDYITNKADLMKQAKQMIETNERAKADNSEMLRGLFINNPYKYQRKTGNNYRQINFEDDVLMKEDMNHREHLRNDMKQMGMDPPLFDDIEQHAVETALQHEQQGVRMDMLTKLSENLMKNQYDDLGRQMFKQKPALGAAVGLAKDDPKLAGRILDGHSLLGKGSTFKFDESEGDMREEYNSIFDGVLPPNENSAMFLNQNYQAVKALYAYEVSTGGDKSIKDLSEEMLGKVVNVNGKATLPFRDKTGKFVSEDRFETIVDNLSPELLEKHGAGKPIAMNGEYLTERDLRDNVGYQVIGDGQYALMFNGQMALQQTKDGKYKPYVLNLKDLNEKVDFSGIVKQKNFKNMNLGGF